MTRELDRGRLGFIPGSTFTTSARNCHKAEKSDFPVRARASLHTTIFWLNLEFTDYYTRAWFLNFIRNFRYAGARGIAVVKAL
jgi:hypothetical protein